MERDRDLKARTNTFLSCEICGKNCWQVSGDIFMLTRTEFCSNFIATQDFFVVSVMAGHLARASQLRRGAYRSTNFCIKISSYLSRVKDRPNSDFCDQKRTPVNESVQYI